MYIWYCCVSLHYTDIRPVYLASFEASNSTGNVTTLKMVFNLSCGIESGATCIVDVIPVNSTHSTSHSQTHNITEGDDLFHPQQIFLTFFNVTQGIEYTINARIQSSQGNVIGTEFNTIITAPFGGKLATYVVL